MDFCRVPLSRLTCLSLLTVMMAGLFLPLQAQTLKVLTMNIWSGLDYHGVFKMGEYEPDSTRELRLQILSRTLKAAEADVIALQECNPVGSVASSLANELGYDYISQRANGGLKIGPVGFPSNLNEGLVLLARKKLRLKEIDVIDLSKTFGVFGNIVSAHSSDQNIALVGAVTIDGHQVIVINTHLTANVPLDSASDQKLGELLADRRVAEETGLEWKQEFEERASLRENELNSLVEYYSTYWTDKPVIVLGDFNRSFDAPEMKILEKDFLNASVIRGAWTPTWDPVRNLNVSYSRRLIDSTDVNEMLATWYDGLSRRIDHVLVNRAFEPEDVRYVELVGAREEEGLFISDHYGLMSEIDLARAFGRSVPRGDVIIAPPSNLDMLPILTYDTDVGFGYGAKAFFLNFLGASESFDAVVFNSTKGERWYRLVFSVPDFELRQGKPYPLSVDVIVDYDKYLKNNFFGTGLHSSPSNRETYTKEPLEIQIVGSRGFNERMIGQIGLKFKTVRNVHVDSAGLFATTLPAINQGRSQALTLFGSFRYDSRNSFINPSSGQVVQLDAEVGSADVVSDYSLTSITLSLQTYHVLFYPKTVFAGRLVTKMIGGSNLPMHAYATLGGTGTLRGYPQDRFLDKAMVLTNLEIRFPIFWRFDGVAFYDAGTVAPNIGKLDVADGWRVNPGFGLRFIMDTFVVRADLGFGGEGTGFYFNFGHLF